MCSILFFLFYVICLISAYGCTTPTIPMVDPPCFMIYYFFLHLQCFSVLLCLSSVLNYPLSLYICLCTGWAQCFWFFYTKYNDRDVVVVYPNPGRVSPLDASHSAPWGQEEGEEDCRAVLISLFWHSPKAAIASSCMTILLSHSPFCFFLLRPTSFCYVLE